MNDITSLKLSPYYHLVYTHDLPVRWGMNGYAVANLLGNRKYDGIADIIWPEDQRHPVGPEHHSPVCRVTFRGKETLNLFWRTVELIKLLAFALLTSPVFAFSDNKDLAFDYKVRWSQVVTGKEIHVYQIDVWGGRGFSYAPGKIFKKYSSLDEIVADKTHEGSNREGKNNIKLAKLSYIFHYIMDSRSRKPSEYHPNNHYLLPTDGW